MLSNEPNLLDDVEPWRRLFPALMTEEDVATLSGAVDSFPLPGDGQLLGAVSFVYQANDQPTPVTPNTRLMSAR